MLYIFDAPPVIGPGDPRPPARPHGKLRPARHPRDAGRGRETRAPRGGDPQRRIARCGADGPRLGPAHDGAGPPCHPARPSISGEGRAGGGQEAGACHAATRAGVTRRISPALRTPSAAGVVDRRGRRSPGRAGPSATADSVPVQGATRRLEASLAVPQPRCCSHPRTTDQDEGEQAHGSPPLRTATTAAVAIRSQITPRPTAVEPFFASAPSADRPRAPCRRIQGDRPGRSRIGRSRPETVGAVPHQAVGFGLRSSKPFWCQ